MKKSMFKKDELFICTGFDLSDSDFLRLPMSSGKIALFKLQTVEPLLEARTDSKRVQCHQKEGAWYRVQLGGFKYI